jgi:hypothetical protein
VQAATWALRSPITVSGMRTFWRIILISVSLKTPASRSFSGGIRRPSW